VVYASVSPGAVYEKNDLVFMLGDDCSQSTRDNAVTALLETFRYSPIIGSVLKQGIPIQVGEAGVMTKTAGKPPKRRRFSILYSLYLYAEKTGRYIFSLKQLEAAKASPEAGHRHLLFRK
jgi:phosphoadenosine phosphosulfate reductase